ncbi:hypothetical protein [Chitinophaga sp. SYP-B3965]|uniref:hypothetical protein n=1 Tax=Chitinophaga sp. SYP-B3965 TaxID=2663120 RepID=UPI00156381E2|nr:hypothetical protein [Chitinophaga sp. SYP-B3965]
MAALEKMVPEDTLATSAELLSEISFSVKEGNDFSPYIEIANPKEALVNLIDKNKKVIDEDTITVIIDYPLTKSYTFELVSPGGFTKQTLIQEICKHYHLIYAEEEKTTTTKVIPLEERKGLINRNETNGKHGIWGHDIIDLVLSEILVYRTAKGQIVLTLGIES